MEKLWVDFNNAGIEGIRLTSKITIEQIKEKEIVLYDGLEILIWDEEDDEMGNYSNLSVKAIVKYSSIDKCWVAKYNQADLLTDVKRSNFLK